MQHTTVQQLQAMLQHTEGARRATPPAWKNAPVRTASPLDRLLPQGGLARGSLVEWLGEGAGSGATLLACNVARAALRDALDVGLDEGDAGDVVGGHPVAGDFQSSDFQYGALVVIDREGRFYPPAMARLNVDPAHLILVRPRCVEDELWSLDQVSRCAGVAAVLWRGPRLDPRHFRRLQLACEGSGVLGLLVRPHTARQEPSWADLRLLVRPRSVGNNPLPSGKTVVPGAAGQAVAGQPVSGRRLQVEVLRCRGRTAVSRLELEIDDESLQIRQAAALRMAARRPARARRKPA